MADCIIVYWRDIPAQVIVKLGRKAAKRELSRRFIETIDRVAMREGLAGTEDYLGEWRRGVPASCGDDLETEADRAARDIEAAHSNEILKLLAETGGRRG